MVESIMSPSLTRRRGTRSKNNTYKRMVLHHRVSIIVLLSSVLVVGVIIFRPSSLAMVTNVGMDGSSQSHTTIGRLRKHKNTVNSIVLEHPAPNNRLIVGELLHEHISSPMRNKESQERYMSMEEDETNKRYETNKKIGRIRAVVDWMKDRSHAKEPDNGENTPTIYKDSVSDQREAPTIPPNRVSLHNKDENGTSPEVTPNYVFPYLGDAILDTSLSSPSVPNRYPEYTSGSSPYTLTPSILQQSDILARQRRTHIKEAMAHAWRGYTKYAFGHDEVLPISGTSQDNWGELGTTLVDSLDTLWIMNMTSEFKEARNWVRDQLSHDRPGQRSVFEMTIRNLGGLLGAYDWSHDVIFLDKADDLGERLLKAFDTPSGLPYGRVDLRTGRTSNAGWTGNHAILSEVGTLSVEFRYLGHATNKPHYTNAADRIFQALQQVQPSNGLYPYFIYNKDTVPTFGNDILTFGAMADSLYEYMLKLWLQSDRTESYYRTMYDKAMDGMHSELLQNSHSSGLTYIADKKDGRIDKKMDHLVCFMGGLLALGSYTDPRGLDSVRAQRDLKTAKALAYTCYQMYSQMPSGLSPEFVRFDNDLQAGSVKYYILRPETVESFFVLHQLTKDPIYREWGWDIFQSIETYCKTDIAYGNKDNVLDGSTNGIGDRMESFFLAETLKYLYLLMDPDTEVDILHKHVFNTEAHPTRVFSLLKEQDRT